ncbi:arsinothricin resistance N-acetyltransferase ArsN1 family A [Neobacillus sp. SCS-31]|uniref:arsinothricin resistance N-acetyltransferase ArsN1 family A n=1 Tax=Neobacillus oceani TaxID=3115292 RepID=UPI0039065C7B
MYHIKKAKFEDVKGILDIYNEGIRDRIATLETDEKDLEYMSKWYLTRDRRYAVLVAKDECGIVGWASLNPYSHRSAYRSVADLSVYIRRDLRGKGIGKRLLEEIDKVALENGFHKIVLFTFPFNQAGQKLYRNMGYREVGVFREQGELDGKRVDVMAMEKLLGVKENGDQ